MISHTIVIHTAPPPVAPFPQYSNTAVVKKDKQEYAAFLAQLPFQKGSIIINRHLDITPDTRKGAFFQVKDIQEIHYIAEYEGDEPKCLRVENCDGTAFWTIATRWRRATTEELALWKELP